METLFKAPAADPEAAAKAAEARRQARGEARGKTADLMTYGFFGLVILLVLGSAGVAANNAFTEWLGN